MRRRRRRRSQQERTEDTRGKILDAAVDCLFLYGYSGTTTTQIAKRAKVSRGAQLHHFPSKAELVSSAVEHLIQRRMVEFREAFDALPEGIDSGDAAIDILWGMVSGRTFGAWLEVTVAARTDRELALHVDEVTARFNDGVRVLFRQLFPELQEHHGFIDIVPDYVFAVLDGLALHHLRQEQPGREQLVLITLKQFIRTAVQAAKSGEFILPAPVGAGSLAVEKKDAATSGPSGTTLP